MDNDLLHSSYSEVTNPETVALLTNPKALHYLGPFLGRSCRVAQAADALGVSPHAMLYWVKKLCNGELLEVVQLERRAGRAIKHYRARADAYIVPLRTTPGETFEALLARQDAPWHDLFRHNLVRVVQDSVENLHTWSLVIGKGENQRVRVDLTPGMGSRHSLLAHLLAPTSPAALTCWVTLTLDFEVAKRLQSELLGLIERYQGESGAQRYLARIALTPVLVEP